MRKLLPLAWLLIFPSLAHAGAWTQKQGEGQLIATTLYYSADHYYDNSGERLSQATFTKYELSPYIEYGLTDAITLGANLSLQLVTLDPDQTSYGMGDSDFFVRARLWKEDGFVVSVEPLVKLPGLNAKSYDIQLDGTHPDLGMGLSAGYSFSLFGHNHFVDLDTAYRYRLGSPEDQLRINGTAGIGITENLMLLPQAFLTLRMAEPDVVTFTQSSGDDYNLLKLQVSLLYSLDEDYRIQLGGYKHVSGENVGGGGGAILSLWRRF